MGRDGIWEDMIFLWGLILVGLALGQSCRNIVTRKEVRSMSENEKARYLRAFRRLHEGGYASPLFRMTSLHVNLSSQVHGVPEFLPWHRHFIHDFQQELTRVDPQVVLPYWDWTLDAREPHNAPVFGWLGGNGQGRDSCVRFSTSPQTMTVLASPSGSRSRCLRRGFDAQTRISSFTDRVGLQRVLSRDDFWEFARHLEAAPHAYPHNNLGGDMRSMAAPNDPIFWLHHAMIDRIYASWQTKNGDQYVSEDEKDSPIASYQGVTIRDTFDTTAYPYCYRYESLIQFPGSNSNNRQPARRSNFSPDDQPREESNFFQWDRLQPRQTPAQPTITRRGMNTVNSYEASPMIQMELQPGVSLSIDLTKVTNATNFWALLQRICPDTLCPTRPHIDKDLLPLPKPADENWITNNNYPILNFRYLEIQYAILIYNVNLKLTQNPNLKPNPKKCHMRLPPAHNTLY